MGRVWNRDTVVRAFVCFRKSGLLVVGLVEASESECPSHMSSSSRPFRIRHLHISMIADIFFYKLGNLNISREPFEVVEFVGC